MSLEITGIVSCHGHLFAEGKPPCYLCLGFISGLVPQGVFLSGAPLPALQGETTVIGKKAMAWKSLAKCESHKKMGSGTDPVSYPSQTSHSML